MSAQIVVAQLNARLGPVDRGEIFEDPLHEALKAAGLGEVTGGGTKQQESGEISYCDIEISLSAPDDALIQRIIVGLEEVGAPKGSKLIFESGEEIPFGKAEGLAVYLNGTDLDPETYRSCDINFVIEEFERLAEPVGRVWSWWGGGAETALYLYGTSFRDMHSRLAPFLADYPLCQRCRVVRIA